MRKMRKGKNKKMNLLIAAAIMVALISAGASIVLYISSPFRTEYFDVEFIVGDSIGFDVNSTALKFGKMPPGSSSTRTIVMENSYEFPLHGKIFASENIIGLLSSSENFTIMSKETFYLDITLSIPDDFEYGNYSGKVKIELRR